MDTCFIALTYLTVRMFFRVVGTQVKVGFKWQERLMDSP